MTEKSSATEETVATDLTEEMAECVRRAAHPAVVGERVSAQVARAAWRIGITRSQAKRLWYKEWDERRIPAVIADRVRSVDAMARRAAARIDEHERAIAALVAPPP
jgi:hypothetical protein